MAMAMAESKKQKQAPAQEQDTNKKWYIINVRTGYEQIAKASIEERVRSEKMQEDFGDVLIPSEQIVELVRGKKRTRSKKFYPGYMFINMNMNEKSWRLVCGATKVGGFIGHGSKPQEVSTAEIENILKQAEGGTANTKVKVSFSAGEAIMVVDGPFSNFNGTVEEVNEEKEKVKVLVSIFGRPTSVELDFIQVKRA